MLTASIVMALAVAVTIAGEFTKVYVLRAVGKLVAASTFVMAALEADVWSRPPHGMAIVAALVFSWIGDVALLAHEKRIFLLGLVSFLIAHLCFAGALVSLGPAWPAVGLALLVLSPVLVMVLRWLGPRAGSLTVPVRFYMAAITLMVALAIGVVGSNMGPVWVLAANLFFVSDLFVARQRFIRPSPWNRLLGLPPYFAAQLLFVYAAANT